MILIHAWADGSFTTQLGGPDMQAWEEHLQAAKHGCVATYKAAADLAPGAYYMFVEDRVRDQFSYADPEFMPGRIVADCGQGGASWKHWAASCISEWGVWFEKVTGPAKEDVLRERLARLIGTRGECSFGVLVNLVRPIAPSVVYGALETMRRFGLVERIERPNPRNKITASLYRLSQPS